METIKEIVSMWDSVKNKSDDELATGTNKMKPLLKTLQNSSNKEIAKTAKSILQYIEEGWSSVFEYEPYSEDNEGIMFPFKEEITERINTLKGMSGGRRKRGKTIKGRKNSRKTRKTRK
jgi:uncharacterized protein YabN with tetrapyrrole methylase and pyrophosphatase domain